MSFVAFSSVAIAVVSFLVWGHHMFVSGQSVYAGIVFSALSFAVAIPSAIKVFNWTATLYKGSISYQAPMLYALGFIGLFTMGGLTGLFLATLAVDVHVHDTYFVVGHFHYIMVGGAVMGYLGGIHFWWPKMTGRLYPDGWARLAAAIIFVGFNLTFFPQYMLGYLGMPRRYAIYPPEFQVLNVMSSAGASSPGGGLCHPPGLFDLVDAVWAGGRTESLGRQRPGVGDAFAAPHRKLCPDARGHGRSLRVRSEGGFTLSDSHAAERPGASIRGLGSSSRRPPAWACGFSLPPK